jgi:hypothetical protein
VQGQRGGRFGQRNQLTSKLASEVYLGEIIEYMVTVSNGVDPLVCTPRPQPVYKGDAVILRFAIEHTIALIEE